MRRPIIGITTYGRDEDNRFRLPCLYVDAVRRAGGVAVLIPPGDDPGEELFSVVDGVILAGGGDIDPALYGGRPHETIYSVDGERDRSELALARHLAGSSVPTLGICRGHQVINVALGGTLHEHLPEAVGDRVMHRLPPREPTEHPIVVAEGSRLASILGETNLRGPLVAPPVDPQSGCRPVGGRPGARRHDRSVRDAIASVALQRAMAPRVDGPRQPHATAAVRCAGRSMPAQIGDDPR